MAPLELKILSSAAHPLVGISMAIDLTSAFPFEFAPQAHQDAELLRQFSFIPGLKELLMVRQVHALEHATVWVLSEMEQVQTGRTNAGNQPNGLLGGLSTERGFYLYGPVDTEALQRAVQTALRRMTRGEWNLAVHPQCGTNLSVGMLLTVGLAAGLSLVMPKDPIGQLLGLGTAGVVAMSITPDMGTLAQRYLTTAIPFNLRVEAIEAGHDHGQPTHFVRVRWVE